VSNDDVRLANSIIASYSVGITRTGGSVNEDYNLFFGVPITTAGPIARGAHTLNDVDPMFVAPPLDDYHVKGTSPAVNEGVDIGVRRDIDLDARPLGGGFDIGADEAAVAAVNAGPGLGGTMTYTATTGTVIQLFVPPGAVSQTLPIYCSLVASNTLILPVRLRLSGNVFELDGYPDPDVTNAPPTIVFNVPVTLTVHYVDADIAGIDENRLKLYRFESNLLGWRAIGFRPGETQTLDVDNNIITATILGFSKFGKYGPQSGAGYELFLPIALKQG
jgi:hypothetical protein